MDKPRQMNIDELKEKEKTYSILELNTAVRDAIKKSFSKYVWVCGEIQDMRSFRGKGHIYFNCVEKDPDSDTIVAQVSAALFAGRVPNIFNKLKSVDPNFKLKNDIEVRLLCQLDLYPKSGRYNIIVIDIDPVYTLGKIAQNRQKIIADLKKRNLLDKNKEKLFPQLPLKVGLITSLNSAAFADFSNELETSNFGFKLLAFGAHMQGKLVEPDVVKALDHFNQLDKKELDVIVVTRGGGSTADLSYFDSQKIAEKIASLDFPVVAAVGHQINTTIIDLMAHTSCKTPTAAGKFLVEKVQLFLDDLEETERSVLEKSAEILANQKQNLQNTALRFDAAVSGYFRLQREFLLDKHHWVLNFLKIYLQDQQNKITNLGKDIGFYSKRLLKDSKSYLAHVSDKIKLLDPKNILKRGYSVTYKEGKSVKSSQDLSLGDKLKTVFYEGEVESEVKRKDANKRE